MVREVEENQNRRAGGLFSFTGVAPFGYTVVVIQFGLCICPVVSGAFAF
jgi:hypothetical protein